MKKTFILIVLVLTGFVFAQNRDCSEILNCFQKLPIINPDIISNNEEIFWFEFRNVFDYFLG